MELLRLQIFQCLFIGNCCHGEQNFVQFGIEALHVVILQLDSQKIVEVNKSFACSTDLERVIM